MTLRFRYILLYHIFFITQFSSYEMCKKITLNCPYILVLSCLKLILIVMQKTRFLSSIPYWSSKDTIFLLLVNFFSCDRVNKT